MTQVHDPWSLTPFERWVEEEGLKVMSSQHFMDVRDVTLSPWDRTGCTAAVLDVESELHPGARINRQGVIPYVCEIPPAGAFRAEKHLYEEMFYVLSGRGATTVWNEDGPKHTFEWGEGSVFSIPLNAWHEINNGQGDRPCRLYAVTDAPAVFNLFRSRDFIYDSPHVFADRFSGSDERYFSGDVVKLETRFYETNFIPNARDLTLDAWSDRGPGANQMINMADGLFICHISEFPSGSYKKAHSHHVQMLRGSIAAGGALILMVKGRGYDLQWPPESLPSDGRWERIDWQEGSLMSAGRGYHQHFNTGPGPARYVVFRPGNSRHTGSFGAWYKRTGGEQIEFENEDPLIRQMFLEELRKQGVPPAM